MGWPQIVIIVIFAIAITVSAFKHGESRGNYSILKAFFTVSLWSVILWFGDFWS